VQTMARIYGRLSKLARERGDVAQSREYRVGVLKARRDWVRVCPGESQPIRELASALKDMAFAEDNFSNQTKYMDEAISLLRGLSKEPPVDPADPANLARFISFRAAFCLQGGDPKAASEQYVQAIAQFEKLTANDQDQAEALSFLAAAYYGMGIACEQLGDPRAKEFYGKGLEIRKDQFDRDNTKAKLVRLMLVTARYGNHVQAKAYAERYGKAAKYPKDFYHLAACYALSSDVVDPDQRQLKETYTDNALKNLEASIDKGYADLHELSTDPDLAPIRDLPGFADILAKVKRE